MTMRHTETLQHAATHTAEEEEEGVGVAVVMTNVYALQHTETLQHTATYCNTLQHIMQKKRRRVLG